jgi:aspartyl-tRNA(Asn)/glutamyl-tRNA(Gln) amidotransferase subunit B
MKNNVYDLYEVVIGIEIHIQLNTKQKIFCYCKNEINIEPNSNICPICCGYPGTLPLFNQEVLSSAVKAGIATNCHINKENQFARKHYFYADLPKGYQITQSNLPICEHGCIEIKNEYGENKKIRILRIHMEEDAGKNIHTEQLGSLVDYNRAGTPLLEMVSYPDIRSADEAAQYLKTIYTIMVSLGITSGNMEDGAFRADTNISVRKKGIQELGTKCELKNINSFKFIKDATEYEIKRQIDLIESGEIIIQQTRLWDTKLKQTYAMRTKETAADYRYLPDPDLTQIVISDEFINDIKAKLPELPHHKKSRLIANYQLSEADADILIDDIHIAHYFESTYSLISSKLVINWLLREVLGAIKECGMGINLSNHPFTPRLFAELLIMIENKEVTIKIAKDIFQATFNAGLSPRAYATEHNLLVAFLSEAEIETIIQSIFDQNPDAIIELKAGKLKAKGFLMGKIMAATKGNADMHIVVTLFDRLLLH